LNKFRTVAAYADASFKLVPWQYFGWSDPALWKPRVWIQAVYMFKLRYWK
jgi:hypothetical protein